MTKHFYDFFYKTFIYLVGCLQVEIHKYISVHIIEEGRDLYIKKKFI